MPPECQIRRLTEHPVDVFPVSSQNPIKWEADPPEEANGRDGKVPSAKSGTPGTVTSSRKVAQIDLVPTVSLLLGTPIPFGSLGGIIPELFSGRYAFEAAENDEEAGQEQERLEGEMKDDPRHLERLCDALLVNSLQVIYIYAPFVAIVSGIWYTVGEKKKKKLALLAEQFVFVSSCSFFFFSVTMNELYLFI